MVPPTNQTSPLPEQQPSPNGHLRLLFTLCRGRSRPNLGFLYAAFEFSLNLLVYVLWWVVERRLLNSLQLSTWHL